MFRRFKNTVFLLDLLGYNMKRYFYAILFLLFYTFSYADVILNFDGQSSWDQREIYIFIIDDDQTVTFDYGKIVISTPQEESNETAVEDNSEDNENVAQP